MFKYAPQLKWDPQVAEYLQASLGAARLQRVTHALARPSLETCLRVNTRTTTPAAVVQRLQQQLLRPGGHAAAAAPFVHPAVPSAVIVPGRGPLELDLAACGGAEVVVNRLAGEAVLQGAHVFAPGLLAASSGLAAGDLVAVTVAVEQPGSGWCGVNRGMRVTPELQQRLPERQSLCVGVGRVTAGRRELFAQQSGLAVEMLQRVFDTPAVNGLLDGEVLLQSLPCIVAAHALDPLPGSRVLDMCAAPGRKTTMLAQLMAGDAASRVVALDRTAAKAARVQQLAARWGVQDIVQVMAADSTQLYQQQQQQQPGAVVGSDSSCNSRPSSSRPAKRRRKLSSESDDGVQGQLPPDVAAAVTAESFDAVLLDAPCSALGLRPRLLLDWRLPQLHAMAAYQRALLHSAVHVLKPGGVLVFCTCTLNPAENEGNVRYVLDKWGPAMRLQQQPIVLGGPGLTGPGLLTPAEAALVQRFDPGGGAGGGGGGEEDDTIGFFVARFLKTARTT